MGPKIPAHVLGFGLALLPPCIYGLYYSKNKKTDEDFEIMLREKYSRNIESSKSKREDMSKIFQQMKESGEASVQGKTDMDQQFAQILQGGKGQAKRRFAVDESLYGTEEGATSLQAAEQKIEADKKKRKKKKKPKKKSAVKDKDDNKDTGTNKQRSAVAVAGGAAVGMVAILALFIGRGAKPQ